MHNLIQEMGRDIVRQESPKDLGKRSRIWDHDSSLNVLREKTGTEQIEGLILNKSTFTRTDYDDNKPFPYRIPNSLKKLALSILPSHFIGANSKNSNEKPLETDAFAKMYKLKLLQLSYVYLTGSYSRFPKGLRWLCWPGFPLPSIPNDLLLEKVVILEMPESNLKNVWNGTKNLGCLKILDLNGSKNLASTPDFTFVTHLERLLLANCTRLVKIHKSLGLLERLDFLTLRNCNSLSQLPRSIGRLKILKTLDISGCSNLKEVPIEMRNMTSLKVLHADGTGKLWNLDLKPKQGPNTAWSLFPQYLVCLSLQNCNLLDEAFPSNPSNFMALKELNLSENPIYALPDCFKGLPKLHSLYLKRCTNLHLIVGIQKFKDPMVKGSLKWVWEISGLLVDVEECDHLNEIEGVFKLEEFNRVDQQIIDDLGLLNFEFVRQTNIALRVSRTHCTGAGKRLFSPQVCHTPVFQCTPLTKMGDEDYACQFTKRFQESRVFMTYICGTKIPDWFNFKNRGPCISFVVPLNPGLRIRGLTLCCVYSWFRRVIHSFCIRLEIGVTNNTKKISWNTEAWIIGVLDTKEDEDITMLNYWKLEGDDLTVGDELTISIWSPDDEYFIAKEIGVRLLYQNEEQEEKSKQLTSKEALEEKTQQICTYEKVGDIDQHVSTDCRIKPYLPIHLENPKLKLISIGCPPKHPYPGNMNIAFGGIILDEEDIWMVGYFSGECRGFRSLEYDAVAILYNKLRGIKQGLKIMSVRGWTGVEVEVDSFDLLQLLRGDITPKEYFHKFPEYDEKMLRGVCSLDLEFMRYLLRRQKCILRHTPFNQWNEVALQLVDMGLQRADCCPVLEVLEQPPAELGLECLPRECEKVGEETKDGHAQLSL
ncbi:hypothetical protein NMG60_11036781 [Bertholletia excelsa]